MKRIISLPFDKYKPVSHGDAYIYQKFDLIQSFIRKVFDSNFHNLLTKPVKQSEHVDFYTDLDGDFVDIQNVSLEQQQYILKNYNVLLHKMDLKCKELEISEDRDNFEWSTLLRKVFDPKCNIILTDGDNFVIAWGWTFSPQLNYILPFDAFSDHLDGNSASNDALEENETNEILFSEVEMTTETPTESIIDTPAPEIDPSTSDEKSVPKSLMAPKKKNGFIRLLDAIEEFFKRFWWLLLVLILLAIILRFYGCDISKPKSAAEMTAEELNTVYRSVMPLQPRIRTEPIDTNALTKDDSSGTIIISNLINIALKNKSANFKNFAVDLKSTFPTSDYEIVYFDDETRRLQLSFPKDKHSTIAHDIRSKLAAYELLIWDESIFKSSKMFNEPLLNDTKRSWYLKKINAAQAWDITIGKSSIVVAVIDDGFDLDHEELKGKAIKPYNVVADSPAITCGSDRKHGTHVAALAIGKSNNRAGLTGIAPGCSFMPIQAAGNDGFFTQTDIIDGILYAIKNDADVINLSLGKEFAAEIALMPEIEQENMAGSFGKDESLFWEELFTMAHQNKVSIVLAAGNSNMIVGFDPMQRSSRTIKVMATGPNDEKAIFSNFLSSRTRNNEIISAPGLAIYSAVPNNLYETMDGTSMAAPIVSGTIALMKSVQPKLSDEQIMKILAGSSKKLKKNNTAGLLQIDKALKNISK